MNAHGRAPYGRGEVPRCLRVRPLARASGEKRLGEVVALFLSTHVNKVDRKGRVSVPATFRATLAEQRSPGIFVFRSFRFDALEAGGYGRMEEIADRLRGLDEFSEEYENLSAMLPDAQELPFDPEGRVILPQRLAEYAHITEQAAFVGLGHSFQIWEPGRFEEHQATMRERARRQQSRLPALTPAHPPG
jgi:MraZ protein